MALTFTNRVPPVPAPQATIHIKRGHSKSLSIAAIDLDKPGRLRAGHLMTLFSISHSTLYNRINAGLIPRADGADGARPFWNTSTIKAALEA